MKYYICLLLQVIPFLLASCGSDDGVEAPPYGDDYVENAFRFEGELFLTSYWSMEREHPALYGIEVLSSDGTPYAYGLFDDPNKAIVKLPEGERFVYRAMVVPDGQTLCKSSSSGFEDIFLITSDGETCRGCELRNEFVYSKSWHFYHFRIPKQSFYYRIFYGCGAGSDCLQGGVVEMETYSIWSLVYVLSKPELTSGRIEYRLMSDVGIPLQYTWDEMTTPIFVLTPETPNLQFIYSYRCWSEDPDKISDFGISMIVGEAYRLYNEQNELVLEEVDSYAKHSGRSNIGSCHYNNVASPKE